MIGFASKARRVGFKRIVLTAFAMIALLLAAAGIFATMHYWVAQRTREIGHSCCARRRAAHRSEMVRYSADPGSLTISAKKDDGMVIVEVRDRGTGISPKFRKI